MADKKETQKPEFEVTEVPEDDLNEVAGGRILSDGCEGCDGCGTCMAAV